MDSFGRQPRKWSLTEDQKLREEVEAQLSTSEEVKDWCRIAESLPGRTNKDCRKRWHNSVAGGLKKGQWSKSEDQLLSQGVREHGHRWTIVANCVGTRSADQCAKRWQQSLDPELDRSEWKESDDTALIDATHRLGRHWKDIQRELFPGRSKNDIKNRYTVLVRRYQNQGIILPHALSSPSECGTPAGLSSYHEEDDYLSPHTAMYDNLLPAEHHSWSDFDNDVWPSPQGYATSTGQSMPQYTYSQPPTLASNMSPMWNQTSYMHHNQSALPVTSPGYGYNTYSQPMTPQDIPYTASTARLSYATTNQSPPTSSGQQQNYENIHQSDMYRDPWHSYYRA